MKIFSATLTLLRLACGHESNLGFFFCDLDNITRLLWDRMKFLLFRQLHVLLFFYHACLYIGVFKIYYGFSSEARACEKLKNVKTVKRGQASWLGMTGRYLHMYIS